MATPRETSAFGLTSGKVHTIIRCEEVEQLSDITVYADESGSTGENLLDESQPVFVVASVNVDNATANSILQSVLSELPAGHGEPKYSSLAKTRGGRLALLQAFDDTPPEAVKFYVAHKKFMVEAKMVDLLIENMAYDLGLDINSDGTTVGLANLFHQVGPLLGSAAAYSKILSSFVQVFRHGSRAEVNDLYEAISSYRDTVSGSWSEMVSLLLATREQAEWLFAGTAGGTFRDTLDPAIPCLVALCNYIGERVGSFRIVHDRSNVIVRNALTLLRLNQLPSSMDDGRVLPRVPFTTVEVADSNDVPQLQIADWAAGAGRQWTASLVNNTTDPFASQLRPRVEDWLVGGIWPDAETITNRQPWPRIGQQ